MKRIYFATCLSVIFLALISSSTQAADWPQWRGIHRDGISPETGLLKSWPQDGPPLVVRISGIGEGYAHPAVVGDRIYIAGKLNNEEHLFCFDLAGDKIWNITCGEAYLKTSFLGSRGTPTVEGDRLYYMTSMGRLSVHDRHSGKEIWSQNVQEKFKGNIPFHGYAESVLVVGDKLICSPHGYEVSTVALNKNTGELIWTANELIHPSVYPTPGGFDTPYSSSTHFQWDEKEHIAVLSNKAMFGLSPDNGRIIWRFDRAGNSAENLNNCSTPGFWDGYVYAFQGNGFGGGVAQLAKSESGQYVANLIWDTTEMQSHLGGYVLVDGYIYGNNDAKGYSCFELKTGKLMYIEKGVGKGSIIYADGMLYTLGENGTMGLVPAIPTEHKVISRFTLPDVEKPQVWAIPAISNGKLFLRNENDLFVYNIQAGE